MGEQVSVEAAHAAIEKFLPRVHKRTAEAGTPITCRGAGCFACCKEPVLCSREEVAFMLAALTEDEREEVRARTRAWLIQVKASGLLSEPTPHVVLWRSMNVYCPLLAGGVCMAYQRRPVSCRVHLALRDPSFCFDDSKRHEQRYAECPEMNANGLAEEALGPNGEPGAVMLDNLGVWLAELLLDKKVPSAARLTYSVSLDNGMLNLGLT